MANNIIIGGSGYIGAHLIDALILDGVAPETIHIVDPVRPVFFPDRVSWHPVTGEQTYDSIKATPGDKIWWLAGPRNSGSEEQVQTVGAMIERQLDRFLTQCEECVQVLVVSSMSIHDFPDNTYAQHKRNVEDIIDHYCDEGNICVVRPGTVIGTNHRVLLLRGDLGVHAAILKGGYYNLNVLRAYVYVEDLTRSLIDNIGKCTSEECYATVAPMSMLFSDMSKYHMLEARWIWPAYSIEWPAARVSFSEIRRLSKLVHDTVFMFRGAVRVI